MNFCDLEKGVDPVQWWRIKTGMQRAVEAHAVRSLNHCLDIVSGTGLAAGGASSAASVSNFFLEWGLSTLPPRAVPLAQHYLSCICGELDYRNNPSDAALFLGMRVLLHLRQITSRKVGSLQEW